MVTIVELRLATPAGEEAGRIFLPGKRELASVKNLVTLESKASCTTKAACGSLFSAKVLEARFIAISLPIAPNPMKPMVFDLSVETFWRSLLVASILENLRWGLSLNLPD